MSFYVSIYQNGRAHPVIQGRSHIIQPLLVFDRSGGYINDRLTQRLRGAVVEVTFVVCHKYAEAEMEDWNDAVMTDVTILEESEEEYDINWRY